MANARVQDKGSIHDLGNKATIALGGMYTHLSIKLRRIESEGGFAHPTIKSLHERTNALLSCFKKFQNEPTNLQLYEKLRRQLNAVKMKIPAARIVDPVEAAKYDRHTESMDSFQSALFSYRRNLGKTIRQSAAASACASASNLRKAYFVSQGRQKLVLGKYVRALDKSSGSSAAAKK